MADLKHIPDNQLRAMADCRAISSADYVEEMERRAGGVPNPYRTFLTQIRRDAPPHYALDDELSLNFEFGDSDLIDLDDNAIGPMPPPPAMKWIALVAAALFIIAVWMVWP